MTGVEKRDFDSPDETRAPDKTRVDVVNMGGTTAARFTMKPGWRWSECVKPSQARIIASTDISASSSRERCGITHEDGTVLELGPAAKQTLCDRHAGVSLSSWCASTCDKWLGPFLFGGVRVAAARADQERRAGLAIATSGYSSYRAL